MKLTSDSEGNYKATQTDTGLSLPPGDAPGRISIDWSFGPIKVRQVPGTKQSEGLART